MFAKVKSAKEKVKTFSSNLKAKIFRLIGRFFALFTIVMLVIMFSPVSNKLASYLAVEMELKKADLVVVLGGGVYRNSILTSDTNERLIHGLRLYRVGLAEKVAFVGGSINDRTEKITSTLKGEEHPDGVGLDTIEATVMKDIAIELGLSESDIFVDIESSNTYQNIKYIERIMREKEIGSCLMVTSSTHIYRARGVYKKLGLNCAPAPVGDSSAFVGSPIGRLALMQRVVWEFAAIFVYKAFGYL